MVQERDTWPNKSQYLLACVGNVVGLSNIWRFPYLVYISGGACFLIPYFTMLFLVGIPCLYMEFAIGLITQRGPVHAMKAICPLFKGFTFSFHIWHICTLFDTFGLMFYRDRLRCDCNVFSVCVLFLDDVGLLFVLLFQLFPISAAVDVVSQQNLVHWWLHRLEHEPVWWVSSSYSAIFWVGFTFYLLHFLDRIRHILRLCYY